MASEKTTRVVLDLDNKEFVKKLKESLGLLGEIGGEGSESVASLASTFLKVGAVAGVAAAGIFAVKSALDMAVEAEHIKQINNSFDALAKSAGLAGDAIKSQLVEAAKGLADDTDILQAANRAIVSMGANANHLGETMEMARKATVLFGGDLIQNFESLNQALAAGNTRSLRQFGLIIDQEKAYKAYAATLGVGVKYLDETQKKQAILNAALEQGKQKFKNVDESALGTTNSLKRIGVSFKEMGEAALLAWDRVAGPSVQNATKNVSDLAHKLAVNLKAAFGQGEEQVAAKKEALDLQIKGYEMSIEQIKAQKVYNADLQLYEGLLKKARNELEKMEEADEAALQAELKRQAHGASGATEAPAEKPKEKLTDEMRQDRQKFEKEILAMQDQRLQHEIETAESIAQVNRAHEEQEVLISQEAQEKIQQINEQYKLQKGAITEQQRAQMILEINEQMANKLEDLNRKLDQDRIRSLENYAEHTKNVTAGIGASFQAQGMQASASLKNMNTQGKMVFGAMKNNATAAFKAIGDGSKNAGEAMKGFMLGAIADIAESEGEFLLAKGIGTYDPVAVAEGGVLIALSAALRAQAGGKGGGGISSGGGGGGGGAAYGGGADTEKPVAKEQEKKSVSVVIHGSLYETEQTRTRLMEMIREAGDFTDFNISRIGQGQ